MPKSIFFIFSILFIISCQKSIEPLDKNIQYSVNIMYVKDDNLASFELMDFMNIFNHRMPFLTYKILGYKIKYNLASGNSPQGFYKSNRNILNKKKKLFEEKNLSFENIIYSDKYWKIIGREIENYNIIIVNIPINSNDKLIDRLVLENKKINPTKSLAIVSLYPLLSNEKIKYLDNKILLNIFEYYILQTVAMIFAKYDIHELERHSIMAEVKDFDYYNWYINIINFNLREPYKSIKRYK
ncbi:hypothetical protein [Brachyspira aalborgi]|uniref:Lipoprotein n=1 Tax=Brachyspira aalborgi TaxID=29522 RepID=A0A5C8FW71_9SPIR|nr:hypothetical protein [Brachyspira aalborgi]TXJ53916.1 hypothetical protein EPJ76_10950 [Brachyspira aalborgi]